MKNCIICGKLINKGLYCVSKERYPNNKLKKSRCQRLSYYLRNKDLESYKKRKIKNVRRWQEKNPLKFKEYSKRGMDNFIKNKKQRFNELMMNNYRKNKYKWICRSMTLELLNSNKIKLGKSCKICGSTFNLQIHHELYSKTKQEILNDISQGKIYYLCKKHHSKKHNNKNVVTQLNI